MINNNDRDSLSAFHGVAVILSLDEITSFVQANRPAPPSWLKVGSTPLHLYLITTRQKQPPYLIEVMEQ